MLADDFGASASHPVKSRGPTDTYPYCRLFRHSKVKQASPPFNTPDRPPFLPLSPFEPFFPESHSLLPELDFEFVNPQQLTRSPVQTVFYPDSPSTTHSPVWLSRNVRELDFEDSPLSPLESELDLPDSFNQPSSHTLLAPTIVPVLVEPVVCAHKSESSSALLVFPAFDYPVHFSNDKAAPRDLGLIHIMDYSGKRNDIVDAGGETDYGDFAWFENRPERPPPPVSLPPAKPYIPQPNVIEQNDLFMFALEAAPNVVYARFKQYGQLGVLAWCSEFGELIDGLKDLGCGGNMFVTTREQALRTCEELLKLPLDLKMQIIVMYLSSQVARLRRFLDGEKTTWNDYPQPQFPLDPRQYTS